MTTVNQYHCTACGYGYDEAIGVCFTDLASNWHCPLCGATKSAFALYDAKQIAPVLPTESAAAGVGVVVIGAGLAGWAVIDALRAQDKTLPITLITADSACRYHKPMLSVAISQQKDRTALVRQTGEQAATDNNIDLLAHTEALAIDRVQKIVQTTQGAIAYDDLVLAMGLRVRYPDAIPDNFAWHVNHLQSFSELFERLSVQPKTVAVIGGGMVGVELAEDLARAGHRAHLLDKNAYPLASLLPSLAGERAASALAALGVVLHLQTTVTHVAKTHGNYTLTLDSGEQVHADELVVAAGLVLDTTLLDGAGIVYSAAGIAVNEFLQSNDPHIFAIGDIIAINGESCRFVAPHRAQAQTIASVITGNGAPYVHKLPPIRLKNKSFVVQATGKPSGKGNWTLISDADGALQMTQHQPPATLTLTLSKG